MYSSENETGPPGAFSSGPDGEQGNASDSSSWLDIREYDDFESTEKKKKLAVVRKSNRNIITTARSDLPNELF